MTSEAEDHEDQDNRTPDPSDPCYPIADHVPIKSAAYSSLRVYRAQQVGGKGARVAVGLRLNPALVGWPEIAESCGGGSYVAQYVTPKGQLQGSYSMELAGPSVPANDIRWPSHLLLPGSVTPGSSSVSGHGGAVLMPTDPEIERRRAESELRSRERQEAIAAETQLDEREERKERRAREEREEREARERRDRDEREAREKREREDRDERDRKEREWREERDRKEREWRDERDAREKREREDREDRDRRDREAREERDRRWQAEQLAKQEEIALRREEVSGRNALEIKKLEQDGAKTRQNEWLGAIETVGGKLLTTIAEKKPEIVGQVASKVFGEEAQAAARDAVKTQMAQMAPDFVGTLTDAALNELAARPDVMAQVMARFAESNPGTLVAILKGALAKAVPDPT